MISMRSRKRSGNGLEHVGGGDEQHVAQIERLAEVVVAERRVLLRIEHLEQRRGRIALEARRELVDLIEHEHRVARAGLAQALDDVAGQRADVGAPVAADLRLVVHAAEARAHELQVRAPARCSGRARSCPRPAVPRSTGSGCAPPGSACAPRDTRGCAASPSRARSDPRRVPDVRARCRCPRRLVLLHGSATSQSR